MKQRNSKLWMLLAVFSFCVMAISIKELSSSISSFQVIFFRSFIGLIILRVFVRQLPKPDYKSISNHLGRNIFHLIGQYGWILGIIYLPLTEVTAIEFSVPIWAILIASIFLNERLLVKRVLSVLIGFIGVLIILKPGITVISYTSLIVVLSAIAYSIAHVFTKRLTSYSALSIVFYMCLIQTPIALAFCVWNWVWPTPFDYLLLVVIATSAIAAHFSMTKALEKESVGKVIPLDYLRLPILLTLSTLIYHEPFDITVIIGGTLIILGNYLNLSKLPFSKAS